MWKSSRETKKRHRLGFQLEDGLDVQDVAGLWYPPLAAWGKATCKHCSRSPSSPAPTPPARPPTRISPPRRPRYARLSYGFAPGTATTDLVFFLFFCCSALLYSALLYSALHLPFVPSQHILEPSFVSTDHHQHPSYLFDSLADERVVAFAIGFVDHGCGSIMMQLGQGG